MSSVCQASTGYQPEIRYTSMENTQPSWSEQIRLQQLCIVTSQSSYKGQLLCNPEGFCQQDRKEGDTCGQLSDFIVNCFGVNRVPFIARQPKFKMQTPESIRTSLQKVECVTTLHFKDTYFHIPINPQSRKCLHFHIQDQSYQFKLLQFVLSTAAMEFMTVVKKVKLMAQNKVTRINQNLDNCLVSARSHQTCLQHVQTQAALSRSR